MQAARKDLDFRDFLIDGIEEKRHTQSRFGACRARKAAHKSRRALVGVSRASCHAMQPRRRLGDRLGRPGKPLVSCRHSFFL